MDFDDVGADMLWEAFEPASPGISALLGEALGDGFFGLLDDDDVAGSGHAFCAGPADDLAQGTGGTSEPNAAASGGLDLHFAGPLQPPAEAPAPTARAPSPDIAARSSSPSAASALPSVRQAAAADEAAVAARQAAGAAPATAPPAEGEAATASLQAFTVGSSAGAPLPGCSGVRVTGNRRGRKPKPREADLQQQLDSLAEQFQHLTQENGFLRNKLKVLERVVPYRDESVGFIAQLLSQAQLDAQAQEEQARVEAGAPGVAQRPPSPSHSADAGAGASCSAAAGVAAVASGSEEQTSYNRTSSSGASGSACGAFLQSAGTAAAALRGGRGAGRPSASPPPSRSGEPIIVQLCPTPDGAAPAITAATVEEMKRVTPDHFRLLWKHICLQLGVLVTGAEVHGPGSSPYVRMERFLERILAYLDKITLLSPASFLQTMYMNVETGQQERPTDHFWLTCARSLQLTPQQLVEVATLAQVYQQNVIPVMQQRLQLSAELSTRLASAASPTGSSGDAFQAVPEVDDLAKQLQRNVLKEHQAHWEIGDFLCSSVLTPLQVSKALAVCFPYIPDGVAMLHAFKLISSSIGQGPQAGQQFPTLPGLLAAHLPAIGALLAASRQMQQQQQQQQQQQGASAAARQVPSAAGPAAGGAPQQQQLQALAALLGGAAQPQAAAVAAAAAAAMPTAAQLQGLAGVLQSGQLQGLAGALQAGQLQALSGALQPGQLQAILAGLQAVGARPAVVAPQAPSFTALLADASGAAAAAPRAAQGTAQDGSAASPGRVLKSE